MKNTLQSLPGIKTIGFLDARTLPPHLPEKATSGASVALFSLVSDVPFMGTPSCEVAQTPDNNGVLESVTLRFESLDTLPLHLPLAFVVTDVLGNAYLIGNNSRPYVSVAVTRRFGSPLESASSIYEVTFSAPIALVRCIV